MYRLIKGDNREILKQFPDNHFDSIVTDPPYGIAFLGKAWDANTGALETYQECLRVLKPGGHILAFSAPRTYHHLAVTLEQAGFEIRDQIMWIYSSGFPKSQDVGKSIDRSKNKGTFVKTGKTKVSGGPKENPNGPLPRTDETIYYPETDEAKQWAGWGTSLKPAHEPICMARKPVKQSIAKNVQEYGTGALNIDATRVPYESEKDKNSIDHKVPTAAWSGHTEQVGSYVKGAFEKVLTNDIGRFPSNVIGEIRDEYQKYFYCPKVSRKERHCGFEDPGPMFQGSRTDIYQPNKNSPDIQITSAEKKSGGNNHPTVKPVALMEYLIKLVTPPNGIILDPFNGSGSTGMAAVGLGFDYVGIDLDSHYIEISRKRIEAWHKEQNPNLFVKFFNNAT